MYLKFIKPLVKQRNYAVLLLDGSWELFSRIQYKSMPGYTTYLINAVVWKIFLTRKAFSLSHFEFPLWIPTHNYQIHLISFNGAWMCSKDMIWIRLFSLLMLLRVGVSLNIILILQSMTCRIIPFNEKYRSFISVTCC